MPTNTISDWLPQLSEYLKRRSSKPSYRYRPLGHDEIRLLRLQPSKLLEESIECEIIHVSLSNGTKYEALSYVWGEPLFTQTINIKAGGTPSKSSTQVLMITESLETALRNLRYNSETRDLWVDQLCINQKDTTERNAQVNRMGEIYSKAQCSVVWLGPRNHDTGLLEHMYKSLSQAATSASGSNNVLMLDQKALSEMVGTSYKDEKTDEMIWKRRRMLEDFLDISWFRRAWVYQEAVVAPRVDMVWGSVVLPLDFITGLVVSVYGIAKSAEEGRWHRRIKKTKGFAPVRTIYHDRAAHFREELNFLHVLWHGRKHLEATNPRDYVYAFRSVNKLFDSSRKPFQSAATQLQDMVKVRYEDSVEEVFTNLAITAIRSSSTLGILQYVVPTKISDFSRSLPSWVPNWENGHFICGSPIFVPGVPNTLSACGDLKHTMIRDTNRNRLHASGHVIGRIETVLKHSFKHTYFSPTLREALKLDEIDSLLEKEMSMIAEGKTLPDWYSVDRRETLLRTILAGGSFSTTGTSDAISYSVKGLLRAYDNEKYAQSNPPADSAAEAESKLRHYLRQTSEVASGKRVFLTDGLDIGLGFSTIRKGDLVCILYGCRWPCILRSIGLDRNQYTFIGLCFLNGWMHHKQNPRGWKWWNSKPEKFTLL